MTATPPSVEGPSKPYDHPFHKPSADVVLCSADGDCFHVHKTILSEASPVFEGMFSLPPPSSTGSGADMTNGLPSIDLEESSRTLDHLLRYCYPMRQPTLDKLNDVVAVLEAMKKYQMDDLVAESSESLLRPGFAEFIEDAFAVYDAVWRFKDAIATEGERQLTLARAARQTFRFKLPSFHSVSKTVTPAALFELMEFRARCIAVAVRFIHHPYDWEYYRGVRWAGTTDEDVRIFIFKDYTENEETRTGCFVGYGCRACIDRCTDFGCLLHVDETDAQNTLTSIVQERPCGQALEKCAIIYTRAQVLYYDGCTLCTADGVQTVTEVLAHLSDVLDKRLSQVPFYCDESEDMEY